MYIGHQAFADPKLTFGQEISPKGFENFVP